MNDSELDALLAAAASDAATMLVAADALEERGDDRALIWRALGQAMVEQEFHWVIPVLWRRGYSGPHLSAALLLDGGAVRLHQGKLAFDLADEVDDEAPHYQHSDGSMWSVVSGHGTTTYWKRLWEATIATDDGPLTAFWATTPPELIVWLSDYPNLLPGTQVVLRPTGRSRIVASHGELHMQVGGNGRLITDSITRCTEIVSDEVADLLGPDPVEPMTLFRNGVRYGSGLIPPGGRLRFTSLVSTLPTVFLSRDCPLRRVFQDDARNHDLFTQAGTIRHRGTDYSWILR
jgi:hypothetical protein